MMQAEVLDGPDDKNRVPVIERMMEILGLLESRQEGATMQAIVECLGLPRTTVYRILNTLLAHGMVDRLNAGVFQLGRRHLAFASSVLGGDEAYDLVRIAMPQLYALTRKTGESSKVSVLSGHRALVVAATRGTGAYALAIRIGHSFALHAGAASKVLLAHMTRDEIAAILAAPLTRYTPQTITDPRLLARELELVGHQGWAHDDREHGPSVRAYAAPIRGRNGTVVATVSIPFLAETDRTRAELIRISVVAAAVAITAECGQSLPPM